MTFKYGGDTHALDVDAGSVIPLFRPANSVENRRFRYWKLERGNLAYSLAVMSDIELVAVYDIF